MKMTFLAEKGNEITVNSYPPINGVRYEHIVEIKVSDKHSTTTYTLHSEEAPLLYRFDIPGGDVLVVVETLKETEWVSTCCGVGFAEGTELSIGTPTVGVCGGCRDYAGFEERDIE